MLEISAKMSEGTSIHRNVDISGMTETVGTQKAPFGRERREDSESSFARG